MHAHTCVDTHTSTHTNTWKTNGRKQSYIHCSVAIMGRVILEFLE